MKAITDYNKLLTLNLYEQYKFDWVLESFNVGEILQWTEECHEMIKEMQEEYEDEYDIDDYIYDYGFGYSCYVCFDEFMGAEYEIYKEEFEKGKKKMSYREFGSINGYGINLEVVTPEDVINLLRDNCDPEIINDLKNYNELADPYRIQNHESHEGHLSGLPAIIHNYLADTGTPFRIEYDIESGDGFIFFEGYFFTDDGEKHYTKKEIDDMLEDIASKLHIPFKPDYVNIRWETD